MVAVSTRLASAAIGLLLLGGCAAGPPAAPPEGDPVVWGDEYEGIRLDADREFADAIPASVGADVVAGETVSTRLRAGTGPVSARWRITDDASVGAMEWRSGRLHAVAGAVRPAVSEGAVVADARDTGAPVARGLAPGGLRVSPSASTWGSSVGGGVAVLAGPLRVAAATWRARDAVADPVAWMSADWRSPHASAGVAVGGGASGGRAVSVHAARARGPVAVSGEVGAARSGARAVVRVVAGERGEWRGVMAGGAADALDPDPPGRWGGAVERRDRRGGVSSRVTVSSDTRRDAAGDDRRRRAEWAGVFRIADGTRLDVNVRVTREQSRPIRSLLDDAPAPRPNDDLRARLALRTRERVNDATTVEFVYRADAIARGDGDGPGVVLLWQGRVRHRGLDLRLQASAFDLREGTIGYIGRAVLPGTATFTALSHRGADLSASLRATWRYGLSLGLQWASRPPAPGAFVVQAAFAR